MAILSTEILFYKSTTVTDTSSNGGAMSTNVVTDNVKNNVWPDVSQAQRTNGVTQYRKVFLKVANDDDLSLLNTRVFVETHTPGEDRVLIFPATQSDTQGDLSGSERLYGAGPLGADVSAGATTLTVNTEAGGDAIFQNGDLIRISNQENVDDVSGSEEFHRLANSGGVSWNGDEATLTLESGASLAYGYSAADTRVAAVIEVGTLAGSVTGWGESSTSGTYDEATYPVVVDHIGGIEQTWTITFTDATNFTCSGDTVGSVAGGAIGSDYSPSNGDFSKPYFTLPSAGWGGTWASGETVTFTTHPAAYPLWEKRVVPAGAASLSGDKVVIAISGESA